MIACFTAKDPHRLWYEHGVPYLRQFLFWMCEYGETRGKNNVAYKDVEQALSKTTDWQELDIAVTGQKIGAYRDFLSHRSFDDFWRQFSPSDPSNEERDIPVLVEGGWYDQFLKVTIEDFRRLRQAPEGSRRRESRLILGPWTHTPTEKIELLNLGPDASFLKQIPTLLKWAQLWMGSDRSLALAPVSFYQMGKNRWLTATDWPPPEAKPIRFYLENAALLFDPRQFVPSLGGRMLYSDNKEGPQDQAFLGERGDVLLWSSPRLEEEMPIVGAPLLHLTLSETPPSFDLSVKLIDLFPNGRMQLITEGYRRFEENGSSIDLILTDTAYVVPPGHRLQIALTHSDFPAYEPNPHLLNRSSAKIVLLEGADQYLELTQLFGQEAD